VALKPAGMPVIPEREFPVPAAGRTGAPPPPDARATPLAEALAGKYGKLFVVHRIDKDTSGLVLLARDKETHAALCVAFQERRVKKTYRAFIQGRPAWTEEACELKLRADGDRFHRTVVDPRRGRASRTEFSVLEALGPYTLVEARPETGRTHQIRVHAAVLGHPVLCDALYGNGDPVKLSDFKPGRRGDPFDERPLLSRLALHAYSLELCAEELSFTAPYPRDFSALLKQLEKRFGPRGEGA
jgi:RluA family pseudouridine synthase